MKVLLLGKGGQVGWELQRSLQTVGELIALDFDSEEYCGDFTDLRGLAQTVQTIRPDIIVNAAAHTAVDKAESEPALANTINALAPAVLATEAAKLGALLVHYSTDYVFNGSGEAPWKESDTTGPLSVYGATKLQGEHAIIASGAKHLIFRTSWVYAARGGNFAKTMLKLAKERDKLTVINDQFGAPTGAELLADVTALAIRHVMMHQKDYGLYHLVASGTTTWFEYARYVIEFARQRGQAIHVQNSQILPVPTETFPTPAKRPSNSRLNTAKLQSTFGITLPDWHLGVTRMLEEIL